MKKNIYDHPFSYEESDKDDQNKCIIRCMNEGSLYTLNFIPESMDELEGLKCPQCAGTKFEIVDDDATIE